MKLWMKPGLLLLGIALGGCGISGGSSAEQTLVANNQQMGTDIAVIRATATVEADRVLITVEHAQTLVREIDNQGTRVQSTLDSRGLGGVPAPVVTLQPGADASPTLAAAAASSNGVIPGLTPSVIAAPAESGTTSTGMQFSNIVMSSSVGADDCATNVSSSFTTSQTEIYIVATASNVPSGTNILSRWRLEGNEIVTHDWTPSFNITSPACIWFYIDQSTTAFTPGNWTVELEANGSAVSAPVAFSITGETAPVEATPGA